MFVNVGKCSSVLVKVLALTLLTSAENLSIYTENWLLSRQEYLSLFNQDVDQKTSASKDQCFENNFKFQQIIDNNIFN